MKPRHLDRIDVLYGTMLGVLLLITAAAYAAVAALA